MEQKKDNSEIFFFNPDEELGGEAEGETNKQNNKAA